MNHWTTDFFGQAYQHIYADRNSEDVQEEAHFVLEQLDLNKKAHVLDMGCGTGVHLGAMASHIQSGIGIDTSSKQLNIAEELKERTAAHNIEFVQDDMRAYISPYPVDAITFFFTTFGYYSDEENLTLLKHCNEQMSDSAKLFLDLQNGDQLYRRFEWQGELIGKSKVQNHSYTEDGLDVQVQQWMDWETKRLYQVIDAPKRKIHLEGNWRVYTNAEITELLAEAGFQIEALFGSYAVEECNAESKRMLVFASK